jgi:hypothetical protein
MRKSGNRWHAHHIAILADTFCWHGGQLQQATRQTGSYMAPALSASRPNAGSYNAAGMHLQVGDGMCAICSVLILRIGCRLMLHGLCDGPASNTNACCTVVRMYVAMWCIMRSMLHAYHSSNDTDCWVLNLTVQLQRCCGRRVGLWIVAHLRAPGGGRPRKPAAESSNPSSSGTSQKGSLCMYLRWHLAHPA